MLDHQGDHAKVIAEVDAVGVGHRVSVVLPFNAHARISDGLQHAHERMGLSFLNFFPNLLFDSIFWILNNPNGNFLTQKVTKALLPKNPVFIALKNATN